MQEVRNSTDMSHASQPCYVSQPGYFSQGDGTMVTGSDGQQSSGPLNRTTSSNQTTSPSQSTSVSLAHQTPPGGGVSDSSDSIHQHNYKHNRDVVSRQATMV